MRAESESATGFVRPKTKTRRGQVLVALAALSYLTSFLRERFLLQHALGSSVLDRAVVAYAIASIIGNVYGIALGLIWIDGRRIPKWATAFLAYAVGGVAVAIALPVVGAGIALASLVAAYEYSRQRAVYRARQHQVLVAAVIAPAATIAVWHFLGVASLPLIVGGYTLGYLVQSGAAWVVARDAAPAHSRMTSPITIAWPAAWAGLTLLNGYLDRLVFPTAGRGWAAASSFTLNLAQAAMLVVVGPLASESVAGRMHNQPTRKFVAIVLVATIVGIAVVPVVLPWVIGGGAVRGARYEQVRNLTFVYAVSIPAAGYWSFRARALQTGSHMWRPMAVVVGAMLFTHVAISASAAVTHHPLGIAAGFTISSWLGAVLVAEDRSQ